MPAPSDAASTRSERDCRDRIFLTIACGLTPMTSRLFLDDLDRLVATPILRWLRQPCRNGDLLLPSDRYLARLAQESKGKWDEVSLSSHWSACCSAAVRGVRSVRRRSKRTIRSSSTRRR